MFNRDRASSRARRASADDLYDWYADELQPKVVRAVAQRRIDPNRACDLHRLMRDLLQPKDVSRPAAKALR
jgi:hypothetical protein